MFNGLTKALTIVSQLSGGLHHDVQSVVDDRAQSLYKCVIEKGENMFVAVDRLGISVILGGRVKFGTAYNVTATLGTDYTDISLYITNHSKRGTYTSMRNSISKGKIEDTHLGSVIKGDMHHGEQSIEITPYYRQRYGNMVNEALLDCRNLGR